LLPKVRRLAVNHAGGSHPWEHMDDQELLQSAGLYGVDLATGEKGYNLAAIMLLGKDDLIINACPAYETDALVRKVNVDRYDDREIIRTNLVESFDQLMEFARKHLPDKFFLEDEISVSLRNILAREMIGNTLMHREYTSSYAAKFIIEKNRMYVENANRATRAGTITPENLEPNPKNPIIASFFRNIGRADRLGSGVRKLFKYSKFYSGQEPQFIEGDVFRIIVPLNDSYSFDYGAYGDKVPDTDVKVPDRVPDTDVKVPDRMPNTVKETIADFGFTNQQKLIMEYVLKNDAVTCKEVEELLMVKQRRARTILSELVAEGQLEKIGAARSTRYVPVNNTK
jgi:ATP-dependent DNA helicase RecG